MLSDGVTDCFTDANELASAFANVSLNVPQSIAEEILAKALKADGGKARDDMTVIVAKLS